MNWSERELVTGPDGAECVEDGTETDKNQMEALIKRLGFTAGPELIEATQAVLVGLNDDMVPEATVSLAWVEYGKIAQQVVESAKNNPSDLRAYKKAIVAAMLHKALIFQTAEKIGSYLGELDRAESAARQVILTAESAAIQCEIDAVVGALDASPEVVMVKLKGLISEPEREHLRELMDTGVGLDEMLCAAWGMLIKARKDPNVFLGDLIAS